MKPAAVIILAAGQSARMGRPKQGLVFEGQTLLGRAIDTAIAAEIGEVIVVLGAHADTVAAETRERDVRAVMNPVWQTGMGSSLKTGLTAAGDVEGIVVMTCDQPRITPELLRQLRSSGSALAACEYGGSVGVPAWFGSSFFLELQSMPDEVGAKQVLLWHADVLHRIAFPTAALDLDSPQDLSAVPE